MSAPALHERSDGSRRQRYAAGLLHQPSRPNRRFKRRFARISRPLLASLLTVFLVAGSSDGLKAAGPAELRIGVLKFGTVNWELDVIRRHGLDRREGVSITVVELANKQATAVALQGKAVDVIVSDWIWVARQRAMGTDYTFATHSMAVGGLIVRPDADIRTLADLSGKQIGVAGGPVDKSWLLLRAYSRKTLGRDLAKTVEPVFAAPPLLNQLILKGEYPAVLTFWHYGARLKAAGMHQLIGISDVLRGLGIEERVPILGWVFSESWAARHREAISGFLRASDAAKEILAKSDAEWRTLRALTKAENDATLIALRDTYRQGIPGRFGAAETAAARKVFGILAEYGGSDLVGDARVLPPGTFWTESGR